MTAQINIPKENRALFIESCEKMEIVYKVVEERELDPRFEIVEQIHSVLFYLGCTYGMNIGYRIHTQTMNELYGTE
mgnify:FL=1